MIEINGLTARQVILLDEMWACDTFEEFEAYLEQQTEADKAECMRLQRVLLLAELDEQLANEPPVEAIKVLDKFRL